METFTDRIAKLERAQQLAERRCRRWRLLAIALLGAPILLVVAGADRPAPRFVEAERFTLKDTDGKVRAWLAQGDTGGPELSLLDKAGKTRLSLCVDDKDGQVPRVDLYDQRGVLRTSLWVNQFYSVQFDMLDEDGKPRLGFVMAGKPDDFSLLTLVDKNDVERFQLIAPPDGSVSMSFFDEKLRETMTLGRYDDGISGLFLLDKADKERIQLKGSPDGSPSLRILDKDGKPVFEAPKT